MAKQNIGIRVPDEVLQAIDERCKTTGMSRTEVVLGLIQQSLTSHTVNASEVANESVSAANATGRAYSENLAKKSNP